MFALRADGAPTGVPGTAALPLAHLAEAQAHLLPVPHRATPADPMASLQQWVDAGLDRLPFPGAGQTLQRWRALAQVARHDLSLVKLFEGHTDALAILTELDACGVEPRGSRWGTWCAEPPEARLALLEGSDADSPTAADAGADAVILTGTKAWCSGAHAVTHALVSCWNAAGQPCLAAVALDQPGVSITRNGWHAVGMAGTQSVDVQFDHAAARRVGKPGDYVHRSGFWHGGAGIAACWYGGAQAIANGVHAIRGAGDPHRMAHLGAIDVALAGAAAVLRETAAWIDQHPQADAQTQAMRARLVVEQAATLVIAHAGRAVGAGPLCRNARFARAMADLPVFLRQSHAERDLAGLGTRLAMPSSATTPSTNASMTSPWVL